MKNLPICIETDKGLVIATISEARVRKNSVMQITLDQEGKQRIADELSRKYGKNISEDAITIDYSRLNTIGVEL